MDITDRMVKFTTKHLLDDTYSERWNHIRYTFDTPKPRSEPPFLTLIHSSNTHFGKISYEKTIFEAALQQISTIHPDLLILTGSLTANNFAEDYAITQNALKELHIPKLILPGFKDLTKYGWDRFEQWIGKFDPTYEDGNVRVIGINTVDSHISNGKVGRTHMGDTCNYFKEQVSPKVNVIALNHRLIPPPKLKFEQILTDSGSVLKNFTDPLNNINLICMGKNNTSFSLQCEESILSYCGSISSKNTVMLNHHSFNVIEFYRDGAVLIYEHIVEKNPRRLIGAYWQNRNGNNLKG